MYKRLLTVIMLLAIATGGFAQRYRPYGGTLNIYSTDVPFFLYINNVLYNNRPSIDLRVPNLQNPRYNLRIVFANRQQRTLNGRGVQLVNRKGQYMDVVFSVSSRGGNRGIVLESMNPVGRYNDNYRNEDSYDDDNDNDGDYNEDRYDRDQQQYERYGQSEDDRSNNQQYQEDPIDNTGYQDKNDANQLNDLLNQKENDQDRLQVAAQELKNRRLRSSEIIDLMELFIRDDNKLAFAKYAYPSCMDKENYDKVGDALSFSSTREKLTAFIKTQR
ncbi:DUF4476 domain-containing protein [Sphingobacterium sp. DR205]|uniref:DUF4476 domain-containing protein n=1 Tax=Sphingobacterium sp. DR205 TaxID=2713573 RepID=UPI0013E416FB|nr:DUF4476 domain-containing protein [Sphingobacterium sp. DR205]QIH36157.1 DUF4476 domain-containing protein [Sphingobacterium sp. DR205]